MNNVVELHRMPGETEDQFIFRLGQAKESGELDLTWDELTYIINTEFYSDEDLYKTESTYRKKYTKKRCEMLLSPPLAPSLPQRNATNENNSLNLREIEMRKIQYRDERNAWQKQNYIGARVSHKLDLLEEKLLSQGRINFSPHKPSGSISDNDILVILSDLHIGQTFSSAWGEYNTDVARKRLSLLLSEIIEIQRVHNSENIYVSLQGDIISGNIHKTIQVSNRENVIEQIKIASELISSFCYELTKHFKTVFMSSVAGNHSRIDKKDEAVHDERLDDIIAWGVELSLRHIENFCVMGNNYDSGISVIDIRGKSYIAVHGDMDKYNKSGVSNLCMLLGYIPYAVTFGHLHTCALDEVNGVKMIRSGSLAGSGDDHTIEKRISGKPSQMVCICNNQGIRCCYPVEL